VRPLVLPEPLTDGVVTVRHWRDEDVPAIVAAVQDPEIPRWTSVPDGYTEADSLAFMADTRRAMRSGERCAFGVVEDGSVAGAIGFPRLSWENARAEVGYWVAAHARGRGVATRAVNLVCAWGFEVCGFHRIELLAATENPASQAVAERAGFAREGVLRDYMVNKGRWLDMVMFARIATDTPNVRR
jgi:RimJ/RimL family protein N-acetyltransferase